MSEIRERPPSMQKLSMIGPLGGGAEDPGAPTINIKNIDGDPPWLAVLEIREHPPSTQKMLMAGPLGGGVGDPGAPTINAKNVDSEPPGR
jgi:hypothetical protein